MNKDLKKSSLNLIREDVKRKNLFRLEYRWSWILNISLFVFFTSIAVIVYFLGNYFENQFDNKKSDLFNKLNQGLQTSSKDQAIQRINIINDRYFLYDLTKKRSLDFVEFDNKLKNIFPYVQLTKVDMELKDNSLVIEVSIPKDAYNNFAKFLNTLKNNKTFKLSSINSVTFNFATPIENTSANLSLNLVYLNE